MTTRLSRSVPSVSAADGSASHVLEQGYAGLRFPEPLESEFRADHLQASHRWVRVSLLVALGTTTGFAIIDHRVIHAVNAVPDVMRFGLQIPVVLICMLATFRRFYQRIYQPAIQICAPLFGIGTVVMACYAQPEHAPLVGARLLLVAFFIYFMLGLRMGHALLANVIVVTALVIGAVLDHIQTGVATYLTFALVCANVIGSAGAYALEHANRTAFLERKLLVEIAAHDGLTRLLNRQTFETRVLDIWRSAFEAGRAVTVLMIDVDDFKRYNDRYGHQSGDECLQRVAATLRRAIDGATDLLARYGGEEFIAVLVGQTAAEAGVIAEQIVADVIALNIEHAGSTVDKIVTVSIGGATHAPPQSEKYQSVARRADKALYLAKRNGRNRSVFDDARDAEEEAVDAASSFNANTDAAMATGIHRVLRSTAH
jgi:diguanylate cyclase (GGDEF)-like protein